MLVDQQNPNILPLCRKLVKRSLNIRSLSLSIHDEEVLLRVRGGCDMLQLSISLISPLNIPFPLLRGLRNVLRLPQGVVQLLSPMHQLANYPAINGGSMLALRGGSGE